MVGQVLPETLEDSANMVPYSKFIIELTRGTSMLDICPEKSRRQIKTTTSLFLKYLHQPPITISIFKITVLAEPTSVELH